MADIALPSKPSFMESTWEGFKGSIKGGIVGAIAGAVGGLIVGAIVSLLSGGAIPLATGLVGGTAYGASFMASVGGTAGAVTGVVQSRERGQPSAGDVVNVAKLSYAQGVAVGQHIEQEQTKFRDMVTRQRSQAPTEKGR